MEETQFSVSDIINSVSRLPAAPRVLPKLQGLLRDPNTSLSDISHLLKLDVALSAEIVRLSNSAYYGLSEPISDISAAVNRVGFHEVYKLAGIVASRNLLNEQLKLYNLNSGDLWILSISCATQMASLSHLMNIEAETAYTVGLLHGLGKIVIDTFYAEQGIEHEMSGLRSVTPDEEFHALGFTHANVAAALLESWHFLEEISIPIDYQLCPLDAPEDYRSTATLLNMSVEVLDYLHYDPSTVYEQFDPSPELLAEAGLTVDELIEAARIALGSSETLTSMLD